LRIGFRGEYLVTEEWIKLHKELNDLYSSPNIFRVIKSIRMIWAQHVKKWGQGEAHTAFRWRNLRE